MEWKWDQNKFEEFHENLWDEKYNKFLHFLKNRTNYLFIIHNKKTFLYRNLFCENQCNQKLKYLNVILRFWIVNEEQKLVWH
jgi:hypothetical protein